VQGAREGIAEAATENEGEREVLVVSALDGTGRGMSAQGSATFSPFQGMLPG